MHLRFEVFVLLPALIVDLDELRQLSDEDAAELLEALALINIYLDHRIILNSALHCQCELEEGVEDLHIITEAKKQLPTTPGPQTAAVQMAALFCP